MNLRQHYKGGGRAARSHARRVQKYDCPSAIGGEILLMAGATTTTSWLETTYLVELLSSTKLPIEVSRKRDEARGAWAFL